MRDLGHEWTERRIRELEKRIRDAYEWAVDDIDDKMQAYIARFVKRDAELRDQLKAGKITQADYRMWLNGQVFQRKRWQATLDDLTETLARANQIAMQIVNEETPEVFAYNANWASYNFEKEMDRRGHDLSVIRRPGGVEPEDKKEPPVDGARVQFGWGLYSVEAVKVLLRDEPTLLPPSRVDIPKDRQWNMKNITRQILQGIVQGEGVEDVARRLRTVAEMNIDSARTHARTAMTAAQNAGRMEQMQRSIELAAKFGEKVQKKWKSAKDSRVRKSHGILDGQIRDPDEPFEVDGKEIMFPGDPQAPPELVYNCRCTMSEYYPDSPQQNAKMRDDDPDRVPIRSMTFKEWMEWKRGEGELYRGQPTHMKKGESGQKVIPQALYNKIAKKAQRAGAHFERSERAERHLDKVGASASQLGDVILLRRNPTISDVLEEVHHFEQRRKGLNADKPPQLQEILNEIDAKKYLISVVEKYKIPVEETETTRRQLEEYMTKLERWEEDHESD